MARNPVGRPSVRLPAPGYLVQFAFYSFLLTARISSPIGRRMASLQIRLTFVLLSAFVSSPLLALPRPFPSRSVPSPLRPSPLLSIFPVLPSPRLSSRPLSSPLWHGFRAATPSLIVRRLYSGLALKYAMRLTPLTSCLICARWSAPISAGSFGYKSFVRGRAADAFAARARKFTQVHASASSTDVQSDRAGWCYSRLEETRHQVVDSLLWAPKSSGPIARGHGARRHDV